MAQHIMNATEDRIVCLSSTRLHFGKRMIFRHARFSVHGQVMIISNILHHLTSIFIRVFVGEVEFDTSILKCMKLVKSFLLHRVICSFDFGVVWVVFRCGILIS